MTPLDVRGMKGRGCDIERPDPAAALKDLTPCLLHACTISTRQLQAFPPTNQKAQNEQNTGKDVLSPNRVKPQVLRRYRRYSAHKEFVRTISGTHDSSARRGNFALPRYSRCGCYNFSRSN